MPKLYFRYGAVGSAKTLNLLAVAHNYKAQGQKPYLVKPALDTRFGNPIKTRAGLEAPADYQIEDWETRQVLAQQTGLLDAKVACVLIDEAQFLTPEQIDFFRSVTKLSPVICYGLRTDFQLNLFPGSRRLMEVADSIEEIKTTCRYCDKKATCNLRLVDGEPVSKGPQVLLGLEDVYVSTCWFCYNDAMWEAFLNEQGNR